MFYGVETPLLPSALPPTSSSLSIYDLSLVFDFYTFLFSLHNIALSNCIPILTLGPLGYKPT